jgi:hypothetical protein
VFGLPLEVFADAFLRGVTPYVLCVLFGGHINSSNSPRPRWTHGGGTLA